MKTLDDLYVSGTVHVALKDKVFQPSNAFRHAKELVVIVRANYSEDGVSAKDPIMIQYNIQICEDSCHLHIHGSGLGCLYSSPHSPEAELSQPCMCDVYAKSWPTECCYCKRVYGTNKRNQNEEFRSLEED